VNLSDVQSDLGSERTVTTHLQAILVTLGVADRIEAATAAIQRGIVLLS
jgi:DNA-binding NarL/FixJ family response regulator